jgi:hypothetical protein
VQDNFLGGFMSLPTVQSYETGYTDNGVPFFTATIEESGKTYLAGVLDKGAEGINPEDGDVYYYADSDGGNRQVCYYESKDGYTMGIPTSNGSVVLTQNSDPNVAFCRFAPTVKQAYDVFLAQTPEDMTYMEMDNEEQICYDNVEELQ